MNFNIVIKATLVSVVAFMLSYWCYTKSDNFLHSSSIKNNVSNIGKEKFSYKTFTTSISLKDVGQVNVESENTRVYVKQADTVDGKIEFTTGSDQQAAMKVEKINNTLTVKLIDLSNYPDSSVTIILPHSVNMISVDNKAADVSIEHVDMKKIMVNTIAGDIKLDDVKAETSKITSVSGDVSWQGSIKQLELKNVSGDVDIESAYSTPDIEMKTVSGNVSLSISKPINARLDIQSLSGEVSTTNSIANHSSEGLIKVRSVSGDIEVEGK